MTADLKYIRHSTLGFVLWPKTDDVWHLNMARFLERAGGRIVSAGFVTISAGMARCYGRSDSLNMGRMPDDTVMLAAQFGLTPAPAEIAPAPPRDQRAPRSMYDTLALRLLNQVKAWRDSDGNEPFPQELREQMDALMLATEVRAAEARR